MRSLNIDFLPSTRRQRLCLRTPVRWMGLVGVGLCLWAGYRIDEIQTTNSRLRAQASQMAAARAMRETANRPPALPPEVQLRAVNQAIGRLNVPWGDFFGALQGASTPHVALLAIEPEASTLTLKGMAEAATPEAMIQYIEALKQGKFFKTVTLSHHEINTADPNAPIRFRFDATW
ncbi:hypothetical protein [Burkholderia sp. Ac-20353]|uniref:hypothetical protein n=1 Tax=Burkholderia sp. Ac-20353 TaxID=2703894 RepID=UPI00197BABC7|nr:hypothetical protein [Burkholderia sp. Ac-20353]MBN3788937.1 hypothetical protein [Burkholderia sp. Ac-20353]